MKKSILVSIAILSVACSFAQNVGIGTASPVTKLDVVGDIALREGTAIVSAATLAVTLSATAPENSFYRVTGTTNSTLNNIANAVDGQIITLVNATTAQTITISNNNTNATGDIITGTGASILIPTGASFTLQYSATSNRWYVTSQNRTLDKDFWKTTGNSGTTPSSTAIGSAVTAGSNFLGTTDAKDLVIATNNGTNTLERMRVTSTGNVGIGVVAPAHQLEIVTATNSVSAIRAITNSTTAGTSWNIGNNYNGVRGESNSSAFSAGVYGYQTGSQANAGGVVGAYSSSLWGGLGYSDANTNVWGIYASGNGYVSGKMGIGTGAGSATAIGQALTVNGDIAFKPIKPTTNSQVLTPIFWNVTDSAVYKYPNSGGSSTSQYDNSVYIAPGISFTSGVSNDTRIVQWTVAASGQIGTFETTFYQHVTSLSPPVTCNPCGGTSSTTGMFAIDFKLDYIPASPYNQLAFIIDGKRGEVVSSSNPITFAANITTNLSTNVTFSGSYNTTTGALTITRGTGTVYTHSGQIRMSISKY